MNATTRAQEATAGTSPAGASGLPAAEGGWQAAVADGVLVLRPTPDAWVVDGVAGPLSAAPGLTPGAPPAGFLDLATGHELALHGPAVPWPASLRVRQRDGADLPVYDVACRSLADGRAVLTFVRAAAPAVSGGDVRGLSAALSLASDVARLAFVEFDAASDTLAGSDAFSDLRGSGATPARASGRLAELVHPDDVEPLRGDLGRALAGGATCELEFRLALASGDWLWVLFRGRATGPAGRPEGVAGVVIDVDRRKRAERGLARSETRYRTVVAMTPGLLHETAYDPDGRALLRWANEGLLRLLGWTLEDVNARGGWDALIHPADRAGARERHDAVLTGGRETRGEVRVLTRSGTWLWMLAYGFPLQDPETGATTGLMGALYDITPLKETEAALRASEARLRESEFRYRTVSEIAPGFIYEARLLADGTPVIEYASAGFEALMGCSVEDYRKIGPESFFSPESRVRRREGILRVRRGEDVRVELPIRRPDGGRRWLSIAVRPLPNAATGEYERALGFVEDITARKLAEERLRDSAAALAESEERFRLAAEAFNGIVYDLDARTGEVQRSRGVTEVLGYAPGAIGRTQADWDALIHPEDRERVGVAAREAERNDRLDLRYRVRHAAGHWVEVWDRALAVRDAAGAIARWVGCAVDVTAQRRLERMLGEAESVARVGSWEYDTRSGRVLWSPEAFRLHGLDPAEGAPTLEAAIALYAPEYRVGIRDAVARAVGAGESWETDVELAPPGATRRWVRCSGRAERVDGRVVRLYGAVLDIDALKRAQLELKQQGDWLRMSIDAADLAAWRWYPGRDECVIEYTSGTMRDVIERGSLAGWLDAVDPADRARVEQALRATAERGARTSVEYRVRGEDGTVRWLVTRATRSLATGIAVVSGTTQDVTARRTADEGLRTQARVLATMTEGVAVVDSDGRVHLTNPAFDRMFGREPGGLDGHPFADLVATEAEEARPSRGASEFLGRRADGSTFDAAAVASPLELGGQPYVIYVVQDVTERRALERELLEISNREQRRIGGDLHDGLGQELTGIALMLRGLASRAHRDQPVGAADLDEVVALVNGAIESTRALARGLSPVELDRGGLVHALRTLAERARELYGLEVTFRSRLESELTLDAAAATHLYRIAQEALTNAARHARARRVAVQFAVRGRATTLSVTDDGRGLSTSAGTGMGLKIMRYRAQMIGGELTVGPAEPAGTRVACRVVRPATAGAAR
jgi:PAS domain S-box-containing protein